MVLIARHVEPRAKTSRPRSSPPYSQQAGAVERDRGYKPAPSREWGTSVATADRRTATDHLPRTGAARTQGNAISTSLHAVVHRRVAVPAWLVAVAIATPTAIGAGALLDGSDERVAAPD